MPIRLFTAPAALAFLILGHAFGASVIWDTPSRGEADAMPLGNGDVRVRLWIDATGDLLCDLSKSNAFDEQGRPLAIGRVRVAITPKPLGPRAMFRQELDIERGQVDAQLGKIKLVARVDVADPVVRLDASGPGNFEMRAQVEGEGGRQVWFHRNERSVWQEKLRSQGLAILEAKYKDPLIGLTSGGKLVQSAGQERSHSVRIHLLAAQTASLQEWTWRLETQASRVEQILPEHADKARLEWWTRFWQQSRIKLSGSAEAEAITRGYAMERYRNAIGDLDRAVQDPLLPYWAMLAAGDLDQLTPLFNCYRDALPLLHAATQVRFQHKGTLVPRRFACGSLPPELTQDDAAGLELTALLLEAYARKPDADFARQTVIPIADEVFLFYDEHYLLDEERKLRIEVGDTVNPMPQVAGLHYVLSKLLWSLRPLLPPGYAERYEQLQKDLPGIPVTQRNGKTVLDGDFSAVFPFRIYGAGKPDIELAVTLFRTAGAKNPIAAAYLGLTEPARDFVRNSFAEPDFHWRFPTYTRGVEAMLTLQAMLMQSDYGRTESFPAWPKEWDVAFRLQADGGKFVEGAQRKGRIEKLRGTGVPATD